MIMNYGHPLKFGTFITPSSKAPEQTVALAKRSEELGYDLVTFQDHPYQPAFLDTWTLLSWVAGQTERIHLAANVLNVPLRAPAVLARSAASLDLLSAGRLDLAPGAGAFWDAIEAMGGRNLAPGEAVEALSEAIASIGYMKPVEFQTANTMIDEAALEAGRDPREIRRLVNISGQFSTSRGGFLQGSSQQWVDELLPLIVDEGVGTFILASDDPRTMEQFAQEVAPDLREAVLRELPETFSGPQIRSAAVRAKRRAGIDYDHVPVSLADAVIEPGDAGYARVKSTYFRGGSPGIVFQVKNTQQVVEALAFARAHPQLPLSIRSGGHGLSGRSTNDGGIVVNLSRMNAIEVLDESTRRVRIEPGARWMHVAAALAPYRWALSSGDYGRVGVGGLATAGGVGWLAREHGLTIDHLRAVEMVLADGSVVRAGDKENADLFWAVRGAGANFGIVTSFEFEVDEVGPVGWAQLVFDAGETADFLEKWGDAVEAAPHDLTSSLIIAPRRGQPTIAYVMALVDSDQPDIIINRLQPILALAPMYAQDAVITSYASVMANAQKGVYDAQGETVSRSGLIEHITPQFAAAAARLIRSGATYWFQIRSVGGAVSDVAPDATAYGNRMANFSMVAFGTSRERLIALWDTMAVHFKGTYLSFETDVRPERLGDAFPPPTLVRLRELKRRYDPNNVFRDNFNIAPQAVTG
jgi:alkanesulfonate monooxygenase SsuD/methylene tetrahydromethanopterin reductase-like flavin-dependent oxidoreductase (luciferase family)